jgi:hypothetical protein
MRRLAGESPEDQAVAGIVVWPAIEETSKPARPPDRINV